jgi:hypothetical protein
VSFFARWFEMWMVHAPKDEVALEAWIRLHCAR